MLRLLARLALVVVAVALGTGCYAGRHHHFHASHHHHGSGDGALIGAAIGLAAGAAILASEAEHRHGREEPVYVERVVYLNGPDQAPLPASPRDRVGGDEAARPGFDAKSARAALSEVDLAPCRAAGAPRGYGHAKVTFNPDGSASKVVVDTPSGLSPEAVKCIGDRLGAVSVPEYAGSLVTVGSTWFIR